MGKKKAIELSVTKDAIPHLLAELIPSLEKGNALQIDIHQPKYGSEELKPFYRITLRLLMPK